MMFYLNSGVLTCQVQLNLICWFVHASLIPRFILHFFLLQKNCTLGSKSSQPLCTYVCANNVGSTEGAELELRTSSALYYGCQHSRYCNSRYGAVFDLKFGNGTNYSFDILWDRYLRFSHTFMILTPDVLLMSVNLALHGDRMAGHL